MFFVHLLAAPITAASLEMGRESPSDRSVPRIRKFFRHHHRCVPVSSDDDGMIEASTTRKPLTKVVPSNSVFKF
jgi:hypothetical protein